MDKKENEKRKLSKGASSAVVGFLAVSAIFGAAAAYTLNADKVNNSIDNAIEDLAQGVAKIVLIDALSNRFR